MNNSTRLSPRGGYNPRGCSAPSTANGSHYRNPTRWEENNLTENSELALSVWNLFQIGWRVLAICLTMLCLVGMTTFLSILYIFIRPFSKRAYRRLACTVGAASFLDAVAILMPNVRLCLTGDSEVPSAIGTSVLVSNHVMEGDWWMMLMLARCIGLRGTVKVFLPNEFSAGTAGWSPASSAQDLTKHIMGAASTIPAAASVKDPQTGPLRTWVKFLLCTLLEFPSLSLESGSDYIKDRSDIFQLLRDFAEEERSCPVQLLLLPEGWVSAANIEDINVSGHQWTAEENALRRKLLLAKSIEFAKREGRPQLRHLILPRTTGFSASLECLRVSNPVVYDVTIVSFRVFFIVHFHHLPDDGEEFSHVDFMILFSVLHLAIYPKAYQGYDGLVPISIFNLTFPSMWRWTQFRMPNEVHVRIKRYSMEEVLQDGNWLDKIWAEKDRALGHFQRHQSFPSDNRGFCKMRVFDTRWYSIENSLMGLFRLGWIPFSIPLLILFSIPLGLAAFWLWAYFKLISSMFPNFFAFIRDAGDQNGRLHHGDLASDGSGNEEYGGGDRGGESTPFFPATPFASPMVPPPTFSS